jgi:hypothetical protein
MGPFIAFFGVAGQCMRSDHADVEAVHDSAAMEDNFPEIENSNQTALAGRTGVRRQAAVTASPTIC